MAWDDYAVVVGIARYPEWGDLSGPENDGAEFARWLKSSDGGDVPAGHVKTLLSAGNPGHPSAQEIDDAFDELIQSGDAQGGQAGRRLYVFLAGHGISPQQLEFNALLAANASQRRIGEHIVGELYGNWFRAAPHFREVVVVMDCCRDHRKDVVPRNPPWPRRDHAPPASHFYAYATQWSTAAREKKMNGAVHGFFTTALLEGLRNTPRDEHGQLLASRLVGYVYDVMKRLQGEAEYQEPEFAFDPRRDFVLHVGPPGGINVRVTFQAPAEGATVEIQDGYFRVVKERRGTVEPWEVRLAPGRYRVTLRASGATVDFDVIGPQSVEVHV